MLKNRKARRGIGFLAAGIILLSAVFMFNHVQKDPVIYGNDEASIIEAIKSTKGLESSEIKIVDIADFDNNRIVGFYFDNKPGYVQFTKNEEGNYGLVVMQTGGNPNIQAFLIRGLPKEDHPPKFMIMTSEQNQAAKLALRVNNEVIPQEIQTGQQSALWIDLAEADKYSYSFQYYNEKGEPISP
ncbi:hypothetical protein ACFSVM_07845 [Paenibacillus shunpengii]|uniref:DUF5590 domain-containing protein n=1 Tax=Paenibacillus shunpengii TaxID=2054424 RepID=A0ABW5SLU3_9BACL|nr:hypothetical protein [Paenibacillus sp. PDC88]SDW07845.1 hypothetical protein SAMN05518848_101182 [Paenibacillus sp. PDC88]